MPRGRTTREGGGCLDFLMSRGDHRAMDWERGGRRVETVGYWVQPFPIFSPKFAHRLNPQWSSRGSDCGNPDCIICVKHILRWITTHAHLKAFQMPPFIKCTALKANPMVNSHKKGWIILWHKKSLLRSHRSIIFSLLQDNRSGCAHWKERVKIKSFKKNKITYMMGISRFPDFFLHGQHDLK